MTPKKLIPLAIVVAIVLILAAMWKVDFFDRFFAEKIESGQDLAELTQNLSLELSALNETDHFLGNPTAKVQVIEYADTTCSHCADMEKVLKEVLDPHIKSGELVWIYRNFLSSRETNKEARYLECVAKISGNEKYWNYQNILFNTPLSTKTESFLKSEASKLGATEGLLAKCLESDSIDKKIEADMTGGIAAGVIGTPYIFVVGPSGEARQIVGLVPKVTVEAAVSQALETL